MDTFSDGVSRVLAFLAVLTVLGGEVAGPPFLVDSGGTQVREPGGDVCGELRGQPDVVLADVMGEAFWP